MLLMPVSSLAFLAPLCSPSECFSLLILLKFYNEVNTVHSTGQGRMTYWYCRDLTTSPGQKSSILTLLYYKMNRIKSRTSVPFWKAQHIPGLQSCWFSQMVPFSPFEVDFLHSPQTQSWSPQHSTSREQCLQMQKAHDKTVTLALITYINRWLNIELDLGPEDNCIYVL